MFGNKLIESIRGTNFSILLFPAGGTNTHSAHCYVINKQKYLDGFSSSFQQMEALSLLKKYQDIRTSTKSNKRHVAVPADFGICSKCSDFVLFYHSGCSITYRIYFGSYYLLTRFLFLLILFFSLFTALFLPFYSLPVSVFVLCFFCSLSLPFPFYILFLPPSYFFVFYFGFVSLSPFFSFLSLFFLSLFLPFFVYVLFYSLFYSIFVVCQVIFVHTNLIRRKEPILTPYCPIYLPNNKPIY